MRQAAVRAGEQQPEQVVLQPRHDHLAFRIAEAGVVFDQLRAVLADHQAGEQHALEGAALGLHRRDRRLDDLAPSPARRSRASPPGPANRRPCRRCSARVAVADALVILRRGKSQSALSPSLSAKKEASSPSRNSSITASAPAAPKAAGEHGVHGLFRLGERHGDDHALAGGEPVGLDHDRRALSRAHRPAPARAP